MIKNVEYITKKLNETGEGIYRGTCKDTHVNVYLKDGVVTYEHVENTTHRKISVDTEIKEEFNEMVFNITPILMTHVINLSFNHVLGDIRTYKIKAARKNWNGAYIYMEKGSMLEKHKARQLNMRNNHDLDFIIIKPHLDKVNSDGSVTIGWCPSQDDMFTDDWKIFR